MILTTLIVRYRSFPLSATFAKADLCSLWEKVQELILTALCFASFHIILLLSFPETNLKQLI